MWARRGREWRRRSSLRREVHRSEHNGRDEKKTHKKVQVTANDLPVLAHLLDASATEERARERRRPAHRRSEH